MCKNGNNSAYSIGLFKKRMTIGMKSIHYTISATWALASGRESITNVLSSSLLLKSETKIDLG
jgi:hypothetical protein